MKKAKKACLLRVWPTFDPKSLGSEWPRLISHIRYKIWQRVSPVNIINDSNTVFPPKTRHLYYLVTELFSNTALAVLNSVNQKKLAKLKYTSYFRGNTVLHSSMHKKGSLENVWMKDDLAAQTTKGLSRLIKAERTAIMRQEHEHFCPVLVSDSFDRLIFRPFGNLCFRYYVLLFG